MSFGSWAGEEFLCIVGLLNVKLNTDVRGTSFGQEMI